VLALSDTVEVKRIDTFDDVAFAVFVAVSDALSLETTARDCESLKVAEEVKYESVEAEDTECISGDGAHRLPSVDRVLSFCGDAVRDAQQRPFDAGRCLHCQRGEAHRGHRLQWFPEGLRRR